MKQSPQTTSPATPQTVVPSLVDTLCTLIKGSSKPGIGIRALGTGVSGLTQAEASLLADIHGLGPVRPSGLAERRSVDRSTITPQVKALEERGLVGRVVDPVDGRASLLQTTSAGARLIENLRAHALAGVGRAVEGWTGDEQRQFGDLFQRFVAALVDTPTR